jgi:serine phosphatase RsbU (regulator of sigma subunit)
VVHHGASPRENLAAIRSAVDEFTGDSPQDDDRTAIIIKRT